jgi:uncharacterized protein YukE
MPPPCIRALRHWVPKWPDGRHRVLKICAAGLLRQRYCRYRQSKDLRAADQRGAMAGQAVRVSPEDLRISSAAVERHTMDVVEAHSLADRRVDTALPYLPGLAATAFAAKLTEWQTTTAAFAERLTDHAAALRTSALEYIDADEASARRISEVAAGVMGETTLA